MPNLYTITARAVGSESTLTKGEQISVLYHDLFDYPLNFSDLIRWRASDNLSIKTEPTVFNSRDGYFFLEGKSTTVYKKLLKERISIKKMEIARHAAKMLSFIPGVKMIAVTGSLAMENASDESDIDLMIVTSKGFLWTTRLLVYCILHASGYLLRKPQVKNERDALCLNMWLDESDLKWKDKNIYTAHEIAQIKPLVNRDKTYEKFLSENKWIKKYWPNSVGKKYMVYSKSYIERKKRQYTICNILYAWLEKVCYKLQYRHMKPKITREVVTPTRALFHPQDWGKVILDRLNSLS